MEFFVPKENKYLWGNKFKNKDRQVKTNKQTNKQTVCIPESGTGVRPALLEFGRIRGRAAGPIKGLKGLGLLLM